MVADNFYPKGEFVFREGESADYAYVLKEGSVEIVKTSIDGDLVLAELDQPNTIFGEMALIDGAPRSAGARASVDSTIDEVRQGDFLDYVRKNPTAAMNIMKKLSTELREANKAASQAGALYEGDADLSDIEIRPTLDRVKESFFNQVGSDLSGLNFLDLFAGTGSMGIEALSRGAEKVVFFEHNSQAHSLITRNLEKCRMTLDNQTERWELIKSDALKGLSALEGKGFTFDLVYVDPPFSENLYQSCLYLLSDSEILKEETWVIVEHFHKNGLHESYGRLKTFKDRRLGDSCLSFFKKES